MVISILGFLETYSAEVGAIASLSTTILFIAWLLERTRKRAAQDRNDTLDQEKEELRLENARAKARLEFVDPERFLDIATELYDSAKFDQVDERASAFLKRQSEAIFKASEYLAEQRLLDSDEGGKPAIDDALRYISMGRAIAEQEGVDLDISRLEDLRDTCKMRAQGIENGEPIEALNMDGMPWVELLKLSEALRRDGNYAIAEVAAKKAVSLARLHEGRE